MLKSKSATARYNTKRSPVKYSMKIAKLQKKKVDEEIAHLKLIWFYPT